MDLTFCHGRQEAHLARIKGGGNHGRPRKEQIKQSCSEKGMAGGGGLYAVMQRGGSKQSPLLGYAQGTWEPKGFCPDDYELIKSLEIRTGQLCVCVCVISSCFVHAESTQTLNADPYLLAVDIWDDGCTRRRDTELLR